MSIRQFSHDIIVDNNGIVWVSLVISDGYNQYFEVDESQLSGLYCPSIGLPAIDSIVHLPDCDYNQEPVCMLTKSRQLLLIYKNSTHQYIDNLPNIKRAIHVKNRDYSLRAIIALDVNGEVHIIRINSGNIVIKTIEDVSDVIDIALNRHINRLYCVMIDTIHDYHIRKKGDVDDYGIGYNKISDIKTVRGGYVLKNDGTIFELSDYFRAFRVPFKVIDMTTVDRINHYLYLLDERNQLWMREDYSVKMVELERSHLNGTIISFIQADERSDSDLLVKDINGIAYIIYKNPSLESIDIIEPISERRVSVKSNRPILI